MYIIRGHLVDFLKKQPLFFKKYLATSNVPRASRVPNYLHSIVKVIWAFNTIYDAMSERNLDFRELY